MIRPSDEDSDYPGGPRSQQDSRFFIVRDQLCFCWDTVPSLGVGLVLKTEDGAPFASLPEAKKGFILLPSHSPSLPPTAKERTGEIH